MNFVNVPFKIFAPFAFLFTAQLSHADTEPQGCYYFKAYNGKFVSALGHRLELVESPYKSKFNISKEHEHFYIRINDTGRFVSAHQSSGNPEEHYGRVALEPNSLGWEEFLFQEKDHSGKYYIKSNKWHTYLRANAENVVDQTNIAQEWELFDLVRTDCETVVAKAKPEPNKCYFIKSPDNRFVHLLRESVGLRDDVQKTEFKIKKKGDSFYIGTADNLYISAAKKHDVNAHGEAGVNHQRHPLTWEAFRFEEKDNSKSYYIKSIEWDTYLKGSDKNTLEQTKSREEAWPFEFLESECDSLPKIIWGFWDKGESALPAFNKYAVSHWRRLLEPFGYRVRILNLLLDDEDNAISVLGGKSLLPNNFDDLDHIVKSYRLPSGSEVKMVPAVVKSDLIRLAVLQTFGGIWMDTSNALLRPLDNIGLAAFRASPRTLAGYVMDGYASPNSPVVDGIKVDGFENWFIAAKVNGPLLSNWRKAFVQYWETRKPGQLITESPMYRDSKFTFGGMSSDAANYLNQHAALKLVLYKNPELGQQIFPMTAMQPWWLHGRLGGDAASLYRGIVAPSMQKNAVDIEEDHVGLIKFASDHLSVIKEHFKTVDDFCKTPNLIALIYGHCP